MAPTRPRAGLTPLVAVNVLAVRSPVDREHASPLARPPHTVRTGSPDVASGAAPDDLERQREREREREEVARAQAGDRGALSALLRRHGPHLYRAVLLPRLGSTALAEEALSQTYTRVIERIDRFTWQGVGIYPWLRVVALRVALDALRARRREVPVEAEALAREVERAERALAGPPAGPDEALTARHDADEARARVAHALEAINPRYALAIRRRVLEERPRDEVARELGVTPATFDVIMHRAMTAMRKALGAPSPEGP